MSGNKNKLIAYNYLGSKFSWLDYLYSNFPPSFVHLVDLFGGSFAVTLNYKGKVLRTANEINGEITNFFQVLRDHENELIRLLELTPISNREFDNCWIKSGNDIEDARRFYVRMRQSFFGLGAQRESKGFHLAIQKINCQGGETISRFINGTNKLRVVAAEIRKNVQIINDSFEKCIDRVDQPGTFFYADPPYPKECRASYNDYKFEFTDEDHVNLSIKLHRIQGLAMVSGYDCDLMNDLYGDWTKTEFPVKKNNMRSGEVQEVIWTNYQPTSNRLTLF